ncbi:NUDIX hydrolase [Alsobacter sp. SYSU M60028]|uniref:NUDIX hydrolase n=1 Tax=Alsobacter ponti TaxID=2962936 RepID=A0ABT1LC29_9HYPH|nr:NUDIX hydrolase [Alsobacter ponti]MCP8939060.1 NUDIX hydrolase [Alsobacter ponti]
MAASTSEVGRPSGDDRLYPARPIMAASVAVFRDGRVLLATRTKPPAADLWSLPGGLVEPGETLEEAALRELREEVGVEARIVGFAGHSEVIERDASDRVRVHFVVNAFAARWTGGEPATGPEAGAVRFVPPEAVAGLRTTKGLAGIVARAAALVRASEPRA